jgi:hypothetical protein
VMDANNLPIYLIKVTTSSVWAGMIHSA